MALFEEQPVKNCMVTASQCTCPFQIAEDANTYGSINSCSAFPFENYLSSVERLIRNGKAPPKQVAKRLEEKYYARRVMDKTSATISCNFPMNFYINTNNFQCAKLIQKVASSKCVKSIYATR